MQPSYVRDWLGHHLLGGKVERKIGVFIALTYKRGWPKNGSPASEIKNAAGHNTRVWFDIKSFFAWSTCCCW